MTILNVETSEKEGYQGYLIGNEEGQMPLPMALDQILSAARKKQHSVNEYFSQALEARQKQSSVNEPCSQANPVPPAPKSVVLGGNAPCASSQLFQTPRTNYLQTRTQTPETLQSSNVLKKGESEILASRSNLSSTQLEEIQRTILVLEKEIQSCWPYPNKDRKQVKVDALNQLIELCKDKEVADAVQSVEEDFHGVRDGRISSRTADLLDKLKSPEATSAALYKPV